jgi:hypothetical protein
MSEVKATELLFKHLKEMPDYPEDRVAFPNKQFTKPEDQLYLRVVMLPARPADSAINSSSLRRGIGVMQISVYVPENKGIIVPLTMVDKIRDWFKGRVLMEPGVRVECGGEPAMARAIEEPGWVQLPVSVPYRTFY